MTRRAALLASVCAAACSADVARNNPYDPRAPTAIQLKGTVTGTVVAEAAFAPADLVITAEGVTPAGTTVEPVEAAVEVAGTTATFSLELVAGTYTIRVGVPRFDPEARFGIVVQPAQALDVGTIVLRAGRGSLTGQVIARSPNDGAPPLDTRVTLIRLVAPLTDRGSTADCEEPGLEEVVQAPLRADGSFTAVGLAAGPYLVVAERDGYVPAFSAGSVEVEIGEVADAGTLILLIARNMIAIRPSGDPGSPATSDPDVTVSLIVPPLYNGMRVSEDLLFEDPLRGDTVFGPAQDALPWSFNPADDGRRELFVQFRAPTCRLSSLFSASIVLDGTPPEPAAPGLANGSTCTNVSLATLAFPGADPCDAGACAGLYEMRYTTDAALDDETWVQYRAQDQLDLGAGPITTVRWQVRDRAGNASLEATGDIEVNTSGPTVGSPVATADGGTAVRTQNVTLAFDVTGADEIEIGNGAGLDGTRWQPLPVTRELAWRLADGTDGPRQVAVRFKDDCGNVTQEYPLVFALDRSGRIRGGARLEGRATHDGTNVSLSRWDGGGWQDTGLTTTTGPDGAWVLTGMAAGTYRVTFGRTGFGARTLDNLTLGDGGDLLVPEITLAVARGSLRGFATLQGEASHEGLQVQAAPGIVTLTGADGAYLFVGLPAGDYLVSASKGSAYNAATSGALVTVAEGQTAVAANLVLTPVPGSVTGNAGLLGRAVHAGIDVRLDGVTISGSRQTRTTTTDDAGDFAITDVTAGSYAVSFSSTGFRSQQIASVVVGAGEAVTLGDVVLSPATGDLTGVVELSGRTSHGGVRVAAAQNAVEVAFTYSDDTGDWDLADLPAGSYTVTFIINGFGTQRVTSVVIEPDLLTTLPLQQLVPQVGNVELAGGVSGSTRLPTFQVVGTYPDASQIRICEDPAVADPDDFTTAQCDYEALAVTGGGDFAAFPAAPRSFTAAACPTSGGPVVCDGAKSVWVRIRTTSLSESDWFELPVVLDRAAPLGNVIIEPTATSVTGGLARDGGRAYTRSLSAAVALVAAEDRSEVASGDAVSGVVTARLYRATNDASPVVVPMSEGTRTLASVPLAGGADGSRFLWAVFEDAAGNVSVQDLTQVVCPDSRSSAVPTDCDGIFYDVTPPASLAFSVNPTGADYGVGAQFATSPFVTLGIDSTTTGLNEDEAVEATIANDASFVGALVQPLSAPRTTLAWALSAGQGPKTVYVRVRDRAGNLSGNFPDTITLDTTPPDTPALVPAGAFINDSTPALQFGAVSDAVTYRLQLSDSSSFSGGTVSLTVNLAAPATSHTPAALADGTYWWRVRAVDAAGHESAFSPADRFVLDTGAPAAPVLTPPATPTADNTPRLEWSAVADAIRYEVQLDRVATFDGPSLVTAPTSATSYTPAALADAAWSVRVRALDAAGNASPYTATAAFTVDTVAPASPVVTGPADAALLATSNVSFAWNSVAGAATYILQVSSDPAMATFDEHRTGSTGRALVLGDGAWTFRVGAEDAAGNRSDLLGAARRTITVDTRAPNTPTLTAVPALTSDDTPAFSWSSEAASGATAYILQIDGASQTIAATNHTPAAPLGDGGHSWTVAARDAAGNTSAFAPPQSFTIDATAPAAPTLTPIAPDPGRVTQPVFTFTAVAGATSYRVEWDTVATFNSGSLGTLNVTTTSAQPAAPLADGAWFARVFAIDAAGNTSPASATDGFTIDTQPPAAPALVSPAANARLTSSAVSFSWSAVPGAATYRLETATEATFATPAAESGLTTTSRAVVLGDGGFFARVIATDLAGNSSAPGAAVAFTVDTTAPATPVPVAVASPTNDNTPTFTWSDVSGSGATGYDLLLDGVVTAVAGTSHTPSALADGTHSFAVRSRDLAGNTSPYSASQVFEVDATPPAVPALTAVAPDPTNVATPSFTWGAVAGAARYTVEWDTASSFNTASLGSQQPTTNRADVGPLAEGTWFWRVRAHDAAANASAYSTADAFTVDTTPPGNVSLTSPADAGASTSSTVSFLWSAATGASSYLFDWSQSATLATFERVEVAALSRALPLPDGAWYWRVIAKDAAGNTSALASATVRQVVVDTSAPGVPVLVAHASPTQDTTPTLSWGAVTGASAYVVTVNGVQTTVAGTSHTTPVLADGTHTWTVAARDAAGNQSANAPSQSLVIDSTPPAAPVAAAYAPDPTSDNTPTVSWGAVTGAATYRVERDTLATFTASPVSATTSSTSFDFPGLGNGTTYWRVFARDAVGNESAASNVDDFTVDTTAPAAPSPTAPADNSTSTSSTITFSWSAVGGPETRYRLQIGSDATVSTVLFDLTGLSATSQALTLGDATYYWRVLAIDGAGNQTVTSGATIWRINVDAHAPAAPILNAVASPTNDATPTFTWSNESGSGATQYVVRIDATDTTVAATTFTPASNLSDNTHPVMVASRDAAGNQSAWSNTVNVTIDTAAPSAPNLLAPAAAAVMTAAAVDFSWSAVTGAATYQFQVARASDFVSLVVDESIATSARTATLADGSYFWRVRAVDAAGNASAFQPPTGGRAVSVDTTPPNVPTLTPAGATVNVSPTLRWSNEAASGAATYRVQIDDSATFSSPDVNTTTSATQLATTLADGTWHWRVQSIDASSNASAYPAHDTFALDDTPPGAPTAPSPAANHRQASPSVTFSWTAPTGGAAAYRVDVAYDSGFTSIERTITTATSPVTRAFPDGLYHWRVFAIDAAGNVSATAAGNTSFQVDTQAPLRPSLVSGPTWLNASAGQATYALEWTDEGESGAAGYEYQVSTVTTFATTVVSGVTASTSVGSLARPGTDGTYYWRVRARDSLNNASLWSALGSFGVDTDSPSAPSLETPANAAQLANGVVPLNWSDAIDENPLAYRLQVGQEPTFTNQIVIDTTLTVSQSNQALAAGDYHWRVWAVDAAGNTSAAPARSFSIDTTPPLATSFLAFPASVNDTRPNLSWVPVAGASTYRVFIDDDPEIQTPLIFNVPGTRNDLIDADYGPLTLGNLVWFATVSVLDAAGNVSAPSNPIAFAVDTIAPTMPPYCTLSQPAMWGPAINDTTPDVYWFTAFDAERYELEISRWNGSGWSTEATVDDIFSETGYDVTFTIPSALELEDGELYEIYVSSVDGAGNVSPAQPCWSDFSNNQSFFVDTVLPGLVTGFTVTTPNPTFGSIVDFQWNALEDVETNNGEMAYQVRLLGADGVTVRSQSTYAWQPFFSPGLRYGGFGGLGDGTYYVTVSAMDAAENEGAPVTSAAFVVDRTPPPAPTIFSPLSTRDGALRSNDTTPKLVWSEVSDAEDYFVVIYNSDSAGNRGSAARNFTVTETSRELDLLEALGDGFYLWTVAARDSAGNSSEESRETVTGFPAWFEVDTTPPSQVFTLVDPANGAQVQNGDRRFTFQPSFSMGVKLYTLRIMQGASLAYTQTCALAPGTDCLDGGSDAAITARLNLSPGTYTWQVGIKDDLGNEAPLSPSRTFIIDTTAPSAPQLVSPAHNAFVNSTSPVVQWTNEGQSGAAQYRLTVEYQSGSNWLAHTGYPRTVAGAATPTISTTVTGLVAGDRYRWTVQSIDAAGNTSVAPPHWQLVVDVSAPPKVANLSLSRGSRQFLASWSSVTDVGSAGTAYYELQYHTDPTFPSGAPVPVFGTTAVVDDLQNRFEYHARVRAVDAAGNPGPWSDTASIVPGFRLANVTPAAVDRKQASPRLAYAEGDLYATTHETMTATADSVTLRRCRVATDDCRDTSKWTVTRFSAGRLHANIDSPQMAIANNRAYVGVIELLGSTYAPVVWTCRRDGSVNCDLSASWQRVQLVAGFSANYTPYFLGMTINSTRVFVGFIEQIAINDSRPRILSCAHNTDCSSLSNWVASTPANWAQSTTVAGSELTLAANDDFMWAAFRNASGLQIGRCSMAADCTDSITPFTAYAAANVHSAQIVASNLRLFVIHSEGSGSSTVQRVARCDLATGCAAAADWSTSGTVLPNAEIPNRQQFSLVRVVYGNNALHATWWRRDDGIVRYASCLNPDVSGTNCTTAAAWEKVEVDPFVSLDTVPAVVSYESNVALVWMDDTNRLRSAQPIVQSPLLSVAGPGVGQIRSTWSPHGSVSGYEQLYDGTLDASWVNAIVLGDPVLERNNLTVAAGTTQYTAMRSYDASGQQSDDGPIFEIRPLRDASGPSSVDTLSSTFANIATATDGSRMFMASARSGNLWLEQCTPALANNFCSGSGWTGLMILDIPQSITVLQAAVIDGPDADTTLDRLVILTSNSIGEASLAWCDLSSGCDSVSPQDFTFIDVVDSGINTPGTRPQMAFGTNGRTFIATRDGSNIVRLHHCVNTTLSPNRCGTFANWTRDVQVSAETTTSHSIAASGQYVAVLRATDTAITYNQCDEALSQCNAVTDFGSSVLITRSSPTLSPQADSLRLGVANGGEPIWAAIWDNMVWVGFTPNAMAQGPGPNKWSILDIGTINTASGWWLDVAGHSSNRYVAWASLDEVRLAHCGNGCGRVDTWKVASLYRNVDLWEPEANARTLNVDGGNIMVGAAVGSSVPSPRILFDGRMLPR